MDNTLHPPILIMAQDSRAFDRFWQGAEFEKHEVKFIKDVLDIHGYKDKLLMIVGYVEGQSDVIDYAKQHNIRVVVAA